MPSNNGASEVSTSFSHTQITVDDITAMTDFFSSVFGMRVINRIEVDFGTPVVEVMLGYGESPTHVLVLVKVFDETPTVQGESMLGFATEEFDAVLERAIAHGAKVVKEVGGLADSGEISGMDRIAIFTDPEGHLCQIIDPIAQAAG